VIYLLMELLLAAGLFVAVRRRRYVVAWAIFFIQLAVAVYGLSYGWELPR
jgi:hypothetical protein